MHFKYELLNKLSTLFVLLIVLFVPFNADSSVTGEDNILFNTILNIKEYGFKGDIKVNITSTEPLRLEIEARGVEFEVDRVLGLLDQLGLLKKEDIKLPFKGKAFIKKLVLKNEEESFLITLDEVTLPPFKDVQPVSGSDITIKITGEDVEWSIGEFIISGSTITDIKGGYYTKERLYLTIRQALLELKSLKEVISSSAPDFYQTILDNFKFTKATDIRLHGAVALDEINVSFTKQDGSFTPEKINAKVKISEPVKIAIVSEAGADRYIVLKDSKGVFSVSEEGTTFATESLMAGFKDLKYFTDNTTPMVLNGEFRLSNVSINKKDDYQLSLHILSESTSLSLKGKTYKILRLSGQVSHEKEHTNIHDFLCEAQDDTGGSLKAKGDLTLPFDIKTLKLDLSVKNLIYGDYVISELKLKKPTPDSVQLEYLLSDKSMEIKGNSRLTQAKDIVTVITPILNINKSVKSEAGKEQDESKEDTPFDFSFLSTLQTLTPRLNMEFDLVNYGEDITLERLKAYLDMEETKSRLSIALNSCGARFEAECAVTEGALNCYKAIKGVSLRFDTFLGCFIHEADFLITGDTNFQLSAVGQGKTQNEYIDSIKGEGMIKIEQGNILKISNLNESIGVIIGILDFVEISPSQIEDTLPFNSFVAKVEGGAKTIQINDIFLDSPLVRVYGNGSYKLDKPALLTIKGMAETSVYNKEFEVESGQK